MWKRQAIGASREVRQLAGQQETCAYCRTGHSSAESNNPRVRGLVVQYIQSSLSNRTSARRNWLRPAGPS